jgi:hypothetical protein
MTHAPHSEGNGGVYSTFMSWILEATISEGHESAVEAPP